MSLGYQNGGIQIAKRNIDVSAIHVSGYLTEPNYAPFSIKYWQRTYLMGKAAACVSKTKKIGCTGAYSIPELIASINAFMPGARAVAPAIEMNVIWVKSWFDAVSE